MIQLFVRFTNDEGGNVNREKSDWLTVQLLL